MTTKSVIITWWLLWVALWKE